MLQIKLIKKTIHHYFFAGLMLLFYLSEGVSKYYLYYNSHKLNLPKYIKIVTILFLICWLLYKRKTTIILWLSTLIIIFVIGQFIQNGNVLNIEKLTMLTKYLFPILLFESTYLHFNKDIKQIFLKVFEYIIIFNSLLIIWGLMTNIQLFKTYSVRFGYNGLFISSATSTYFYIVAIFYLYINKDKTIYFYFISTLTILSALLVGTKSVFLFLMLLMMYIAVFKINKRYRIKALASALGVILLLTIFFFVFEPSYLDFIKNKGLLTAILSYRDELFINNTLPFIKREWQPLNYLFGGIDNVLNRSQLGFFDLLLTFGFIGSFVYLYSYFKSLIKIKINREILFFIIAINIIIALGGNFFFSATVVIYFVIIQQIFIKYDTNLNE